MAIPLVERAPRQAAPERATELGADLGLGTRALHGVRRLLKRLAHVDRLYRERAYLASMDDHMLRDIGVTRAQIDEELRRPVEWRRIFFGG